MPNSWAVGDKLYCNGYSGEVTDKMDAHPLMGTDCFEVKIVGWEYPVILSASQMEMFVKVTG